ncbi:MAG TPA: polysaccharide biosynthesis/export family protein [Edaphobacter sp.]|nr:polysaccharide biosynthesis/export family protein [Edaphobacter sp.]
MKQCCFRLTVMLVTISAVGFAQAPKTTATPAPSTPPVSSSPAPAQVQPQATAGSAPVGNTPVGNTGGPLDPNRYVIGAEDSLQITVWKDATLSGTVPVRPDGMISLNLVGDLKAAGLTPMALAADISQRLKKYLQDPVVTVVVLGVNSQRIFAVGELNKVGPLMLTPGMTVLQAIVSAGGLTPFASSKHIYILRTVAGKQQKLPFNYKQALKGDNQEIMLIPGDTIVVP